MKITKEQIKLLDPCEDGYRWYLKEGTEDLLETLLKVNKFKPDWAIWLYTRLMSPNQNRRIAIFAAEQVLHIFENEYPDDKRPRLAIEAAKAVLLNDTEENRERAKEAASASYASGDAAYVIACSATDLNVFACLSACANSAAYAASAAYTAYAAAALALRDYYIDKIDFQELIIKEAVRILEKV